MLIVNAIFTLFTLLWLIGAIAGGDLASSIWFALAFTLLCAANTINLLGRQRRRVKAADNPASFFAPRGEPVADRPDVPAAYGVLDAQAGAGLLVWRDVSRRLAGPTSYWVCTTRPDGRPHATPVWGVWLDEVFYFGTHRESAKARNLAANPYLSLHLDSSDEVVIIEGPAQEVVDDRLRARVDQAMAGKYDLESDDSSADPNPLFAMRPRAAFSWSGDDFAATATRWTFST